MILNLDYNIQLYNVSIFNILAVSENCAGSTTIWKNVGPRTSKIKNNKVPKRLAFGNNG